MKIINLDLGIMECENCYYPEDKIKLGCGSCFQYQIYKKIYNEHLRRKSLKYKAKKLIKWLIYRGCNKGD